LSEKTKRIAEWRKSHQGELPENLEFRVIHGDIPPGTVIRDEAAVSWDRFLAVGMP